MPIYRKIIITLANSLFRLLLFFTISIVAATFIYTDRNYIPSVLDENNVYSRFVSALLETNKDQSLAVGSDLTLANSEVQQVIKDSFPAKDLRNNTETVVFAHYMIG
jgi:hypothetical protein